MTKKKNNKKNKNGQYKTEPPYMQIENKAWDLLTKMGKLLYAEFIKKYNGNNANEIELTFKEIKEKKIMSVNTFNKVREELIEKGLVDLVQRGTLWNQSNIYRLSHRWRKYGTKEFEKVNIKNILPPVFKTAFKKGHKFHGNQYTKKK
jgi:hypothetical protein